MKNRKFLGLAVVLIAACINISLCSAAFTTLTTAPSGGLTGHNAWSNMTFGYEVTSVGSAWHYEYVLTDLNSPGKNISHLLLEVSSNVSTINEVIVPGSVSPTDIVPKELALYTPTSNGASDPGLPGNIYAVKFEKAAGAAGASSWRFSFDSLRRPVDGNFYAKDGKTNQIDNYVYNTGFADIDGVKIKVPDTVITVVPAPAAILLGGLGLAIAGFLRRKNIL